MTAIYPDSVVVATTKVGIFKQITTPFLRTSWHTGCCCYHKGRNFQANHNKSGMVSIQRYVVVATTKVGIFKQITTGVGNYGELHALLLLPQR